MVVEAETEVSEEAVLKWYNYGGSGRLKNNSAELSSQAKRYLSANGWVLWYALKNGKQELRYRSPNGKNYYSLKTACKGYIDEGLGDRNRGKLEPKEPKRSKCLDPANLPLRNPDESQSMKRMKLLKKEENLVVKSSKPKTELSGDFVRKGNLESKEPKSRNCLVLKNRILSKTVESESPNRIKLSKEQENPVVKSSERLPETALCSAVLFKESDEEMGLVEEEKLEKMMQELYTEITITSSSYDTYPTTVTSPLPSPLLSSSSLPSSVVRDVSSESNIGASMSDSLSTEKYLPEIGNGSPENESSVIATEFNQLGEEEKETYCFDYRWMATVLGWESL